MTPCDVMDEEKILHCDRLRLNQVLSEPDRTEQNCSQEY